jgi:hypothetical protein
VLRAIAIESPVGSWKLQIVFDQNVDQSKIKDFKLYDPEFRSDRSDPTKGPNISLGALTPTSFGSVYEVRTNDPLQTTTVNKSAVLNHYLFNIKVEDGDGNIGWQSVKVQSPAKAPVNKVTISKADSIDDADVYVDGDLNGAFKKKTRYATNISLRTTTKSGSWRYGPFFKLSASTDPDADPDSMQFGLHFRYLLSAPFNWENEAKVESERDFDNTNLIFSSRIRYVPAGYKLGEISQANGKKAPVQIFFRPYLGTEMGKNLNSPLPAAEGDGVARIVAGADLRLNIPLNREKKREIDWNNSYTRRWLLTDELGFEADDDGNLQLVRFGKSPRDYFNSNFTLGLSKFLGTFIEYEWGQTPPSYKLVNHRFRVGFVYKFKFGVE